MSSETNGILMLARNLRNHAGRPAPDEAPIRFRTKTWEATAMNRIGAALGTSLLGLFLTVWPAEAQPAAPGGKFCVRHPNGEFDLLLVRPMPDGSVSFGLSTWASGGNFVIAGMAGRTGSGWLFSQTPTARDPTERCVVTLAPQAGGYAVATREGARCEAHAGPRAVLRDTLRFTAQTRIGDAPLRISPEIMMRESCNASQPRATSPATPARPRSAVGCPATADDSPVDGFSVLVGPPGRRQSRLFSEAGSWSVAELGQGRDLHIECVYAGSLEVREFRVPASAGRCISRTGRDFRCE